MIENSWNDAIKEEDFTAYINSLSAEKCAKEFESLTVDAPFTRHAAKLLCNKTKNRYRNVTPCKFFLNTILVADVVGCFR